MTDVKRFRMTYGGYDGWADMAEDSDGDWVEFSDYDTLLRERDAAVELLREARASVEYRRDNADDSVNCDEIEAADLLLDRIDALTDPHHRKEMM